VNEKQRRTKKTYEKGKDSKGFFKVIAAHELTLIQENHQEKPTDYLFPSVGESVLSSSD
jgi:hypothetical protein